MNSNLCKCVAGQQNYGKSLKKLADERLNICLERQFRTF